MSHKSINKFKKISLDKSSIEVFLSILSEKYDNIAFFTTSSLNNSTLKTNLLKINPSNKKFQTPNYEFLDEKILIDNIDYYHSNVIARASKTMGECKSLRTNFKKTGTEG